MLKYNLSLQKPRGKKNPNYCVRITDPNTGRNTTESLRTTNIREAQKRLNERRAEFESGSYENLKKSFQSCRS